MLNIGGPSVKDVLQSFAKVEFWYGALIVGGLVFAAYSFYEKVNTRYINVQHELAINNLENKVKNLQLELMKDKEKYIELNAEYSNLSTENTKLVDQQRNLLTAISKHCDEQRRLVRTLQKDHKLQVRFDMNYEYRSILEKVLITMFENAETCYQATK